MRVAIGAVMKDEAPYILEWVAFHAALGFEIIIADNGGTDTTSELLSALAQAGVITRLDLRNLRRVQLKAYRAIIRTAKKNKIDILGFMDVDEFFCRTHPLDTLSPEMGSDHIANLFDKFSASQFSFHWKNFGGSSDEPDIRMPVLRRFYRHAQTSFYPNVNVKSFFSVASVTGWSSILTLGSYVISSHWQWAAKARWFEDGRRIYRHSPEINLTTYDNGCILHFPIKSPSEFELKQRRGDVVFATNKYTQQYYEYFDVNEIESAFSALFVRELEEKILSVEAIVAPFYTAVPPQTSVSRLRAHVLGLGVSQVGGITRQWNLAREAIRRFTARLSRKLA